MITRKVWLNNDTDVHRITVRRDGVIIQLTHMLLHLTHLPYLQLLK